MTTNDDVSVYRSTKIELGDKKYSNVEFIFREQCGQRTETVYAHSTVLFIECPVLYQTKIHGQKSQNIRVDMTETNADVFKVFLELIYVGHSDQIFKHFRALLLLCQKFDVLELMQQPTINNRNALDAFQIGLNLDHGGIKSTAINVITQNYVDVLKTADFTNISKCVFSEILKLNRDPYNFEGEMIVVNAINRYIETNGDQTLVGYEKYQPFRDLIDIIQFSFMDIREFAECIDDYEYLLTNYEIIAAFKKYSGFFKSHDFEVSKNVLNHNFRILEKSPDTCETTILMAKDIIILRGFIPRNLTTFRVNQPITITKIVLFGVIKGENIDIDVRLRYQSQIIATSTGTANRFKNPFDRLVVLVPNKLYSLEIDYKCYEMVEFGRSSKSCQTQGDGIKLIFDDINSMLYSLDVKPTY